MKMAEAKSVSMELQNGSHYLLSFSAFWEHALFLDRPYGLPGIAVSSA